MKLKLGVRLEGVQPQLVLAMVVADGIYRKHGQELVITSVNDSRHMKGSLHYKGMAMDLRTNYFSPEEISLVVTELKESLGRDFDVVNEGNHIHVEYDPK